MIEPTQIGKLISQIATSGKREINSTLPMLLRILDKKGADKYLVQLGKLIIETKSDKPLKVGTNYWANVRQGKDGLVISDLIKQPKIMENLSKSHIKLTSKELSELLNDANKANKHIDSVFKDFLLERLPFASSRQEFLELSNLLIALQNGVFSMVIQDDNGKDNLVQIKKQVDFLEFYSIFPNLGEISGIVTLQDSEMNLRLQVMSEKVKDILTRRLDDLIGFNEVQIEVSGSSPLWEYDFSPSYLLNIKG